MPLVETLAFQLGTAVTKAILKLWLNPSDAAGDLSADIVDILKDKTPDVIARRKGVRQFEAIGDRVASNLLPVFLMEGDGIDENRQSVIAAAVGNTINRAAINPSLLVKYNLDLLEFSKYLIDLNPQATRDFSDRETSLYKRILFESSGIIVDIAAQLPSFTENAFSEVLKREDYLVSTADQVLDEIRRIREASQQPEQDAERFEKDYRGSVIRNLDRIELFGLDISSASRRHRLSIAYVTLMVRHVAQPTKEQIRTQKHQQNLVCLSANQALSKSRRLLVCGEAGSGKTTLLQWIAVRSASLSFSEDLADWNKAIPFLIRLRQCVESGLPAPEEFPRFVASAISNTMPPRWVHKQLYSGRGILLVDGIDEFPEAQRHEVYSWLEELSNTFSKARIIVTARPYAINLDWLIRQNFDYAELQPMDLAAMEEFVDYWHNAVRIELHSDDEQKELGLMANNLKTVLQRNYYIYSLATNPLLCAMLCALHRDRGRQLPYDRIELYEAGCAMLLERRDLERRIELKDYPRLTYRQKRALLQDLAYWMLKNSWAEVDRTRAEERLNRRLDDMDGIQQDVGGIEVCRLFIHRSGLVREPIPGKFDFTHRTFQEFLAARAALDEDDLGILIQNATNDQWREVIVLAAGLASAKASRELIDALITHGDENYKQRHRLHLLAIACLETAVELPADMRAKMQLRMEQIIPPKNLDEAQALASTGSLVTPHLPKLRAELQTSEAGAVACVRALVLIHDKESLDVLSSYINNESNSVLEELINGWQAFDTREYFQQIISPIISRSKSLKVRRVSSLSGFEYLTDLVKLEIEDCHEISNFNSLESLVNLTELSLRECTQMHDIAFITGLTKLTTLALWDCEYSVDLSPLIWLENLVKLSFKNWKQLYELAPIAKIAHLTHLDIRDCSRVSDLSPVLHLKNLDVLLHGESHTQPLALKVFLCHSSTDKPSVRALYSRLQNDGFNVWLDEESLLPGQDWQSEIPKAVRSSDVIIVFISRSSMTKTGYVQKEIRYALDAADEQPEGTVYIIPAKLEDCHIPERLARFQWVNLWEEKGYQRLLRALRARAESTKTTARKISD